MAPGSPAGHLPTAAEKAESKAKAAAAKARAAQASNQGQAQADQAHAGQADEQTTGQAANQKATAARGAAAGKKAGPMSEIATNGTGRNGDQQGTAPVAMGPVATPGVNGGQDKAPASADEDPGFQAVIGKVQGVAAQEQTHAPATAKAKEAQAAAESPASELAGQAQSGQVNQMDAAETPGFDAAAFKQKLLARITAITPKTAADADEFKERNEAGALKGEMQGETAAQKERSQAPLAAATGKAPDAGSVEPKPVTPVQPNQPGEAPAVAGAEAAAPKPKGQSEVEAPLQQQSQQLDQQMAGANVTEEQLVKSNEPEFQAAATAKAESQSNAQTAPQAYRQDSRASSAPGRRKRAPRCRPRRPPCTPTALDCWRRWTSQQTQGKSADEKQRAEVGAQIQTIYDETKIKVEGILSSLGQRGGPAL